jgi:hypothetical protein
MYSEIILRIDIPRSVISAKVKLALRWRSTLSENTKVLRARKGSPEKKSVSPRYRDISYWYLESKRWISYIF